MIRNIKLWINNNQNAIRISKFSLISIIFLLMVWFFDISNPGLKKYIPQYFLLPTNISSRFLSNLSGVFLTVATFSFTTILTVASSQASSLSPRIVQNFIGKKNILSLIGIFTGGFFYTILSLFMLQKHFEDELLIAGTLGVIYAIASMIYFLGFVYQILKYVKGSNLIQDSFEKAEILIQKEAKMRSDSIRLNKEDIKTQIPIYAKKTGFIYGIDHEEVFDSLKGIRSEFVIKKKYGDYIAKGEYVADINLIENIDVDTFDNEIKKALSDSIIINTSENSSIDYHYELATLKEIALKNLSPAFFNSDTALDAISKLSVLLGKLLSTKNKFILVNSNENTRIIYTTYSVEKELYLSFNQIIFYAQGDPKVSYHILDSIYRIYLISDESALDEVETFFIETYKVLYKDLKNEMDQKYLDSLYKHFIYKREQGSDRKEAREE